MSRRRSTGHGEPLRVKAGRRTITVANPDKILVAGGVTKADLAHHYARVAPVMLPLARGRPINLERYPDGPDGPRIIQQHAPGHFPDWIERVTTEGSKGPVDHVVLTGAATLVYLADQGCVTVHGWQSRVDRLDRPDRLVIDLDPADGGTPDEVRAVARTVGTVMRDELGLEPFVMATGSRGYHVVIPLQRRQDHDEVRAFARDLARVLVDRDPDHLTLEWRKVRRRGRIYVDVLRNAYAHTAVLPYAVRPRPGGPVAAPLRWDELSDRATRPDRFTVATIAERLDRDGDPWADLRSAAQALGAARRRLDGLLVLDD